MFFLIINVYLYNVQILFTDSGDLESCDLLRILQRHPLIDLFRLICWNPQFCCVPLHELVSMDDFLSTFTIPFLARVLTLLQVMIQYPHEYHAYMKDIKIVSSNACLTSLFSTIFIHPDIVVANKAVLEMDLYYFTKVCSIKEQKYMLCLFSCLAPNSDSRLANFGRVQERQDMIQSKFHGKGSSTGIYDDDDDVNAGEIRSRFKDSRSTSIFVEKSLSKVCIIKCKTIYLDIQLLCITIYLNIQLLCITI
jgi:hypothetical protein